MLSVSPSPLYFVRLFFSQLLFVSLNPVCWKNEGSSRPGSSGANCLKFFLLAKVFCNALQNSSGIALLALDVLCGLDTVGSFNENLVCWRICLGRWLLGAFHAGPCSSNCSSHPKEPGSGFALLWAMRGLDRQLLLSLSRCFAGVAVGYCIANSFPRDCLQTGTSSRRQWPLLLHRGRLWLAVALSVSAARAVSARAQRSL